MKAVITAAGYGKRLKEKSLKLNKCLLEVNKKPVLEYNLDAACGCADEIIIVVGYLHQQIENKYGDVYNNKPIKYIFQKEQKGLVNAIECAREAVDRDDFMLFLGDEIITSRQNRQMKEMFQKKDVFGICGVVEVEDRGKIRETYMVETQGEHIVNALEKPAKPINNLMGTGNCIFTNDFFKYIDKTNVSQRFGEKILTDVMVEAIKAGETIDWFIIGKNYANINKESDYMNALDWWNKV